MKILASDYDGTLRTGVLVDKKDRDAIVKFQKDGNHFGIVTGRSMESLQKEIEVNNLTYDFIITNNGGVIFDKNGNLLECRYMDFDKALDIISYIKNLECVSYVINDGYHRFKFDVDKSQVDHKYANMEDHSEHEEEVLDRGKIAQLVISLNDDALAEEIAQHINTNFRGYAIAYVNVNCVDIVPEGVSKAEALYYIEDEFGYDHDAIYTIGDSFNDVPMLEEFHGVSVAHAKVAVQVKAEKICKDIEECIDWLMSLQ